MYSSLISLLRSWKRNKSFLVVNIAGLSIGLGISILLLLYVLNEWSYDRHFRNKDRIVQLNSVWIENGTKETTPICLRKAYLELPHAVPGIEKAVQIYRGWEAEIVYNHEHFPNLPMLYADPEFFDIFEMKFVYGSAAHALTEPHAVVLTREKAEAVFGKSNPVGQVVNIDGEDFIVSAVVEKLPANTHLNFDILASMNSIAYMNNLGGLEFFTYYLLRSDIPQEQTCAAIRKEYVAELGQTFAEYVKNNDVNSVISAITEPLVRIHLFSQASFGLSEQGNIQSVLMLIGLAVLILSLAILNFVNIFVVQSQNRSAEVGIRKTSGAGIREIAWQFFGEASIVVLVSFVLGLVLALLLLPAFSVLINKQIHPEIMLHPLALTGFLMLIILTIVLSAIYPSAYMSQFKPVDILKKNMPGTSKKRFSNSIVAFQSVIAIVLISMLLIINKQTAYLKSIPAGFNGSNVLYVNHLNKQITDHYETLRQNLQNVQGVKMVSSSQHLIGGGASGQGVFRFGQGEQVSKSVNEYRVLPGLCELMEFQLKDGRFFNENDPNNRSYVLLNEKAAQMLNIRQSEGEKIVMFEKPLEVIGIVKDFYYTSPAEKIEPIILTCYKRMPSVIYIRFDSSVNKADAIQRVTAVFHQVDPEFIMNSTWYDDFYSANFNRERNLARVIFISTLISLFVALIGLFAIHSFIIARRIKEIGIRKVSGSSTLEVISLLSKNVVSRILLSAMVAIPVAWYCGNYWLETYANRIHPGILLFVIPLVIHMLISLFATLWVSYNAASRNPVEALRYE